jgi:hypothetical protein
MIGSGDLLKKFLGLKTRIEIRMVLASQISVSTSDLGVTRRAVH